MFTYKIIDKKENLLSYFNQINQLFNESFKKDFDFFLWEWAYLKNPFGEPIVSLAFLNKKLVGHYAVIPLGYSIENQHKFCLSMTTMVDSSCRRYGLFTEQANQVYNIACKQDYSYVLGFPNKNSLPGFKKRLGWIFQTDNYIACVKGDVLFKNWKDKKSAIDFNCNSFFLEWRLNKPKTSYLKDDNLILKPYKSSYDLLAFNKESLKYFNKNLFYNILVDSDNYNYFLKYKVADYQFGYKPLNNNLEIDFCPKLILSDVF